MASPTSRAPVRVADVLAAAVPGLGQHLLVERIRERWESIVGPEGSRRSNPESLRQGVLTVAVASSAWLQELTLRSAELLARVRSRHGSGVTALRFALGRLPDAREEARRRAARPRPLRPLGADDRREIEQMTATIADPALAAVVERLLTKDRLARGAREAQPSAARES